MRNLGHILLAAGLALAVSATAAFARSDEENLRKLGSFKRTDAPEMRTIEQNTKYADNLRKVLKNIKLPDGFKIELFALAPDARHMAIGRNKGTVWIGTRKKTVWAALIMLPIRFRNSVPASNLIFPTASATRRTVFCMWLNATGF